MAPRLVRRRLSQRKRIPEGDRSLPVLRLVQLPPFLPPGKTLTMSEMADLCQFEPDPGWGAAGPPGTLLLLTDAMGARVPLAEGVSFAVLPSTAVLCSAQCLIQWFGPGRIRDEVDYPTGQGQSTIAGLPNTCSRKAVSMAHGGENFAAGR